MTKARQKAFEELKDRVEKYSGELGNIHDVLEEYLKKVEIYSHDHKVHELLAQIEAISGLLLVDVGEADKLLKEIEVILDDHTATKIKVKELFELLEGSYEDLAGIEVLEEEVNDILEKI
jgi:hypothetical protein